MQEIVVEKSYTKEHIELNNPTYVEERVRDYDCTRYCRICPFPGLKCCKAPDAEALIK